MTKDKRFESSSTSPTSKLYKKSHPLCISGLFILGLLFLSGFSTPAIAGESGYIVYASPSSFTGGVPTTVTVRVRNTGDSDDMIIEWDSKPSGWSISPGYRNPYMPSGSYYNATFTVTPPVSGGSGTIVWKFYDDDVFGNDLLDTEYQSVSASASKPDLIAYSISVSDTTVNPGQSITVYWTAKNQGTASCGSSQQGVMWSTNSTISRSDTLLEKEYLGGLSSGQSTAESHTITIPSNATPGSTYYLGVYEDYDLTISESSETNNASSGVSVTINIPPKPDLVAYSISASDTTVNPGQSVTIYWTAKNQGDGSCGSSQQGVMWSTNSTISRSDTLLEKEYLGGLSPGQSTPESHTITIPSNATPGSTYYIGIIEDYDYDVDESNENNNNSNAVAVTVNAPDLIAYSCTVTDTTVDPGQSITVNWTAKNQGNGSCGPTQQGVMWSTDSTISRSDSLLEKEYLGSMGVNVTSPESHTITIPTNATPDQTYYIGVYADYDLSVNEGSNENNNNSNAVAVTINIPPKPDLIVSSVTGTQSSYYHGQNIQATATIQNVGDASAGSSDLKYYLGTSSDQTYRYIEQGSIGSLGIGDTDTDIINWPYWTIPEDIPVGTYYVWVQADSSGDVDEGDNEDNNWGHSSSFTIASDPPPTVVRLNPPGSQATFMYKNSITFSARGEDDGGDIVSVDWVLDGPHDEHDEKHVSYINTPQQESSFDHTFDYCGDYTVTCTFSDDSDDTASISWDVFVGNEGNIDAQEYGDAVYREISLSFPPPEGKDHTALFAGIQGTLDTGKIIEVGSLTSPVVISNDLSTISDSSSLRYWGAYTLNNNAPQRPTTFEDRKTIIDTAITLIGRDIGYAGIPLPTPDCLRYYSSTSGSIDISDIKDLRCDGLIEYCYEKNSFNVWGREGQHYDISQSTSYCDEHNNFFEGISPQNPDTELAPVVQRGAAGGTSTFLTQPAEIDYPTYTVDTIQIDDEVRVDIIAQDQSGTHWIEYRIGESGSWETTPVNLQHPDENYLSTTLWITSSCYVYYHAMDNGGNIGDVERTWVEVFVPIPPIISAISDESTTAGIPYAGPFPGLEQGTLPIEWSLVQGPGGMTIDSASGVVSWPNPTIVGSPHIITIRASNSAGYDDESWELTVTGDPPVQAIPLNPTNGETDVSINTLIGWSNGGGAASYDVYFGTDNPPTNIANGINQTGMTFDPGTLSYDTTYYWRIDAKNSFGTTEGDLWNFTTELGPIVPDPEPDIDSDGTVNFADFAILASQWPNTGCGEVGGWCDGADVDYSGAVNFEDLRIMAEHWLEINMFPIDDFESGDLSSWSFGGDTPWVISSDEKNSGDYAASSGVIIDDQWTYMYKTQDVPRGYISFARKVSSEYGYAWFVFYIDGEAVDIAGGDSDWKERQYFVNASTHVFYWSYQKDSSVSEGSDRVWVDDIVFYPQAADSEVCSWAELRAYKILGEDMSIEPGEQCSYVPVYETWVIGALDGGFTGTFNCPTSGQYELRVTHQTSASASCPGGGYAPVTISVNGSTVVSNYDPAENHGGTHGSVTDSWTINANAGSNAFEWIANDLCTNYWIQKIEILSLD